ncbi:hypothetical protein ACO22_02051 [Paracoccidioides brasiliensis]|uniref:ubiquitinyl hydrolase 1 n=1 Tax=Paracoccidioides brasiliensis TaxID=121759 RepID=A0A1D2JJU3_PARBR|nr:hypothetical protein ACO22_02051 [Paracoccidioides brasiliensis]
MTGISAFLPRRDKRSKSRNAFPSKWRIPLRSNVAPTADQKLFAPLKLFSVDKSDLSHTIDIGKEDLKIEEIQSQLLKLGVTVLGESQIRYALRSEISHGDVDEALEFLVLLEDSLHGIINSYNPSIKLLGAENRNGVTCYLDALLFAMFARLDSFEVILHGSYDDEHEPQQNLSMLLRLWVNLLRSGKLITKDITKQVQDALAQCGWHDAAQSQQQDVSEAFTFITEQLNLPLLTLKMDIFHTGKEEAGNDHKYINERLLQVAIPTETADSKSITLEDCLEAYFNNQIAVKRYLDRKYTEMSVYSTDSVTKDGLSYIETSDLETSPTSDSPISRSFSGSTKVTDPPVYMSHTPSPIHLKAHTRSSSIIVNRFIPEDNSNEGGDNTNAVTPNRLRRGTFRKEVLLPAWQMFSLIPWYTDSVRCHDAASAVDFSSKRPILGICLKRYSVLPNGNTVRLDTFVDIPIEIGLPYFIQDDEMEDGGPLYRNFKLSLQSAICHRGNSIESGHYIALARGTPSDNHDGSMSCRHWMRFDDLTDERITIVDIESAIREESPYLLFYRIVPIDSDSESASRARPSSSYGEPGSSAKVSSKSSLEGIYSITSVVDGGSDAKSNGASPETNLNQRSDANALSDLNSTKTVPENGKEAASGGEEGVCSTSSCRSLPILKDSSSASQNELELGNNDVPHSHSTSMNGTIITVEPIPDGDFEMNGTDSFDGEKRKKSKHAKVYKENTQKVPKHKNHHSLKKRGGKLERECIVI